MTLVHAMLAGGDGIGDADLLRYGATSQVLGHRVMAPSTLGTFLRAFTFGHVRQLDRLTEQLLTRAWAAGAGPGDGPMTMDLDSTKLDLIEASLRNHLDKVELADALWPVLKVKIEACAATGDFSAVPVAAAVWRAAELARQPRRNVGVRPAS